MSALTPEPSTPMPPRPEPSSAPERCAPAAQRRGDQRHATAAPVTRWFLVEQPGPWGRNALLESRLDARVAQTLHERAAKAGVRVMLVRRPGRGASSRRRHWAYVDSRPGQEATWWGRFTEDDDLLQVPWDGSAGTRTLDPTFLVCAHARHDTCCAVRGRPVAAALAALRPQQTWECSHTGGDRFAANLILLPHGFYYGHVTPAVVPDLLAARDAGQLDPTWLRGRSCFSAPVQAAQHHARLAGGDLRLDALAPISVTQLDDATWQVQLDATAGPVTVVIQARTTDAVPRLTCSSGELLQSVRVFDLVSLA